MLSVLFWLSQAVVCKWPFEFTDEMVQEGLVKARARIQRTNAAQGGGDPPEEAPPATLPAAAPPPPPDGLESAALI
mgnify:CR=1 FL=1